MTKAPTSPKDESPRIDDGSAAKAVLCASSGDSPRMEAHTVCLPWPDKRLSPNARVHWRTRAAAVCRARRVTAKVCEGLGGQPGLPRDFVRPLTLKTRVPLTLSFYPPDKRRRDDDNLIAAFKPYRDALANHLLIDDSLFECRYALCGPAREHPKGAVVVSIGPMFEKNG